MSQQGQTLEFFSSHSSQWQEKALDEVYSVIQNRHQAVHDIMKAYPKGSKLLDVGCGTGQLAIESNAIGWDVLGLDFAEDMIAQCKENNHTEKGSAKFICDSIFTMDLPEKSYDVVSAMGFIEYVSLDQFDEFLSLVRNTLKPGGSLALGSRNRLFNIVSLNAFTEIEIALGTIDSLLKEAIILQTSDNQADAIKRLREISQIYDQPEKHPTTGIKVDTRYQFTPGDLVARVEKHGFETTAIYPVHYQSMPTSRLSDENVKGLQKETARYLSDNYLGDPSFTPFCSSLVLSARRV